MLNEVTGTSELCAWQPVPGFTWVQTRNPKFAQNLARRSDARLVMTGVQGGYLRTFEFRHSIAWAKRLIARYSQSAEEKARISAISNAEGKGATTTPKN